MSERNTSHLVQRHAGQAGGHVTALLLWIGHRVAVQSQQLLQRKLTGLRAQKQREAADCRLRVWGGGRGEGLCVGAERRVLKPASVQD
ncbi:hypothetical protein EYF80_046345 [Liparis tanakae]|uniref:Uncharacterized protein n=1 Tax=Liparis tanakae TaxID=230148 RepID=A0A4Z2FQE5_9TELE|nr:hypothetical protein EYF80_046345 [Liparis tanakae]